MLFSSETFQRGHNYVTPHRPIATRSFLLEKNIIEIEYFSEAGSIRREKIVYKKAISRLDESTSGVLDIELYERAMLAEKVTLSSVRTVHQEIQDLLRIRRREEDVSRIIFCEKEASNEPSSSSLPPVTVDNSARVDDIHQSRLPTKPSQQGMESGTVKNNKEGVFDYLSPFLLSVVDPNNISKEEAILIRDACLKTMKERLQERANIIQHRIYEENQRLAEQQELHQLLRTRDDDDDEVEEGTSRSGNTDKSSDENFERICSEIIFRINILERRLRAHEDTVLEKYKVSVF